MGSDAAYKNEIAPAALAAADGYFCDRLSQVRLVGELHHAIEAGAVGALDAFPELGEVIAGQKPGRSSDAQCLICDLTGTGVQDTAIANLAVVPVQNTVAPVVNLLAAAPTHAQSGSWQVHEGTAERRDVR